MSEIQLNDRCGTCGDTRLQHASRHPYDHEFNEWTTVWVFVEETDLAQRGWVPVTISRRDIQRWRNLAREWGYCTAVLRKDLA